MRGSKNPNHTWIMKRMIWTMLATTRGNRISNHTGFLGSTLTGLTCSSTPPCGVAFVAAAVAAATAEDILDDMASPKTGPGGKGGVGG
jgi:hypothetical protein